MKFQQLSEFHTFLKQGREEKLYLFIGEEEFDRKQLEEMALGSSHGVIRFRGESLDPKKLFGELNTLSLFQEKKWVVVRGGEKLDNTMLKALAVYALQPNPAVTLILTFSKLLPKSPLYANVEQQGIVVDLPPVKPWEKEGATAQWIAEVLRKEGRTVQSEGIQLLIQQLGHDRVRLQQEIEKVICYAGSEKQITLEHLRAITASIALDTVWSLGESVMHRDGAGALRIGKGLLGEHGSLIGILATLRSQLQTGLMIASLMEATHDPQRVAAALPQLSRGALQKKRTQALAYGKEAFIRALHHLFAADLLARNSAVNHELLLEKLMVQLCQK